MNYWLDLFTVKTLEEFQKAGAKVSGFRERRLHFMLRLDLVLTELWLRIRLGWRFGLF